MKKSLPIVWSVAALVALSIPLTISISNAQDPGVRAGDQQNRPPQGQPGQFGGPGQGQPGGQFGGPGPGQGQGQFRGGMGGGGGVTMAIDGGFIYLVQGNRIMKISKEDLKITKTAELQPMGQPPRAPGGGGGDGQTKNTN